MALNPSIADWQGRVVWLVGASSGIGRALAEALAARGARVAVSARQVAPLQAFAAAHPGALALPMDIARPGAASEACQRLLLQYGRLDVVVYCAGHYRPQRATAYDLAQMQQHLAVNYGGALQLLEAVLPPLLAQGSGHVSLVSSVAGYRGLPQGLAYGPTKAALINLAETLYQDLRPAGIGVSLVNPGFVKTPMTAQNDFTMPALLTPEAAAQAILDGWSRGAFEIHFPRRFTLLMKLLRLLPYRLYFRVVARATGL